jgi:histidinol-phosphate aminotransferase
MAFASEEIIALFNKVKYPYNLSTLVQQTVLEQLNIGDTFKIEWVNQILKERESLSIALKTLPMVEKVYPTDANFFLVKVNVADKIYKQLVDEGIIVRNRNSISLCGNCLRITVGTKEENNVLINCLKMLK